MRNQQPPNRIRALRDAQNLSVRDLADRSGVDQSTINRMERGNQALDYPRGKKIAEALGVRFSALLNDADVELRANDVGNSILAELQSIPEQDRAQVIFMSKELARIVRASAARHNAGALSGEPQEIGELAEMWNNFDDQRRRRALDLLRISGLAQSH